MGIPQVFGVCISGGSGKINTRGLWKTTVGRNRATKSQQSYHWTWLGLPLLAAVVFVIALGFVGWWLLAAWLVGAAVGWLACRGVAVANGVGRGQP